MAVTLPWNWQQMGQEPTAPQQDPLQMIQALLMKNLTASAAPAAAATATNGAALGSAGALLANPMVAIPAALGLAVGGEKLLMRGKRKAQKERRDIKARASAERSRETLAITDAAEGAARRAGGDVAEVAAASGMGGAGPAFQAVMRNRLAMLGAIPGQVAQARDAVSQREREDLAAVDDGSGVAGQIMGQALPLLGGMDMKKFPWMKK